MCQGGYRRPSCRQPCVGEHNIEFVDKNIQNVTIRFDKAKTKELCRALALLRNIEERVQQKILNSDERRFRTLSDMCHTRLYRPLDKRGSINNIGDNRRDGLGKQ
jgi:hypothetical protein